MRKLTSLFSLLLKTLFVNKDDDDCGREQLLQLVFCHKRDGSVCRIKNELAAMICIAILSTCYIAKNFLTHSQTTTKIKVNEQSIFRNSFR